MRVRFTWDLAKAKLNERLHGISFETAAEVFDDPNHVVGDNYFIERAGEQRYQIHWDAPKTGSAPGSVRRPQPAGCRCHPPDLGTKGS
jgi:uncharacterized DUF497 family protein